MDESVAYGAKIRATIQPSSLSFHNNAVRASSNPHAISRSCLPLPTFAIIPPSPVPPHRLHPRPAYARMHAIFPNHGTDNIAIELRHCMVTLNNANMSGSD
jgi:hypothetical protein